MDILSKIPKHWQEIALFNLLREPLRNGHSAPVSNDEEGVRAFTLTAVTKGDFSVENTKLTKADEIKVKDLWIEPGDILIQRSNTPELVGTASLYEGPQNFAIFPDLLIRIRLNHNVSTRFVERWLQAHSVRMYFRRAAQGIAGSMPKISQGVIEALQVPLAPTAEQRRIVDVLDAHLTRLDAAAQGLKRVEANLKRYRASVLKAAVEGRLVPTEAELAKKEGREYECASVLLEQIRCERRRRWEKTELASIIEKGRAPKDNSWREAYQEPMELDSNDLPSLPQGWCWVRAEQVSDFITKGTTPAATHMSRTTGEIPFIKVYNLTFDGSLDFSIDPTFITNETHAGFLTRSECKPDDVLMNIVGPPLGKISVVPSIYPKWNINQAIARYRPIVGILSSYLSLVLRSEFCVKWCQSQAKATSGQFNLTLEIARNLPIPLAPLAEQARIVQEEQRLLSQESKWSSAIGALHRRLHTLRQSILKWAFEGKLVDQDPNDEPASVLLSRIRKEREAKSETSPKRGRPRKAAEKSV